MKKFLILLLTLFFLSPSILAANLYNNDEEEKGTLKPVFQGSNDGKVLSVDFNRYGSMLVSSSSDGNVKIWDVRKKELIKTLMFNDLIKAKFADNDKKLLIITNSSFYIYGVPSFKRLSKLNMANIRGLSVSDDTSMVNISYEYSRKQDVYEIASGKLLHTFKKYGAKSLFSPDEKYLVIADDHNISIMDIKNKSLLTTLPKLTNEISSIGFIDDENIYVFTSGYYHSYGYLFNIKTAELEMKSQDFKKYGVEKALYAGEKYNFIIFNDGRAILFDLKSNKAIKDFSAFGKNNDDEFIASDMVKNRSLIAVGHAQGDIKIYGTKKFITAGKTPVEEKNKGVEKNITAEKDTGDKLPQADKKQPVQPKVIIKEVEKVVIVKETKKRNLKPSLSIYASKKSGYAPLDVTFKIIANDEDGEIAAYYLNIAGKEFTGKENPMKVFNYTFDKPGSFNIVASVKDDKNAITTKEMTIKVREESFEDFKHEVFGGDE